MEPGRPVVHMTKPYRVDEDTFDLLKQIAEIATDNENKSFTIRMLIRDEAKRRGLKPRPRT